MHKSTSSTQSQGKVGHKSHGFKPLILNVILSHFLGLVTHTRLLLENNKIEDNFSNIFRDFYTHLLII